MLLSHAMKQLYKRLLGVNVIVTDMLQPFGSGHGAAVQFFTTTLLMTRLVDPVREQYAYWSATGRDYSSSYVPQSFQGVA